MRCGVYSRWCTSCRVCIRQCLYGARAEQQVVCTLWAVVYSGGRGVQQAAWAQCVQSVWCCRRPEMLDSLPPGPHRIPAQGWWPARAARQRWMWGRVVSMSCCQCLINYPSAGQGEGHQGGILPRPWDSPLRLLSPLSPGSLSPVPTWPCCLLVADQDHTTPGHRGPGIQVPAWRAWSCPLRWG